MIARYYESDRCPERRSGREARESMTINVSEKGRVRTNLSIQEIGLVQLRLCLDRTSHVKLAKGEGRVLSQSGARQTNTYVGHKEDATRPDLIDKRLRNGAILRKEVDERLFRGLQGNVANKERLARPTAGGRVSSRGFPPSVPFNQQSYLSNLRSSSVLSTEPNDIV